MKIPQSVRSRYEGIIEAYITLKQLVDVRIQAIRSPRWHYESRVKELESYALKLETGREHNPGRPEDMFGCTLVVENHSRINDAVKKICDNFRLKTRRPREPKKTALEASQFSFEDLRLYVAWDDDPSLPPTGLTGYMFEVQIKTFLQHAWGIATHDLVYKTDSISWGTRRVAFQVKAMLENAELSISEAKSLTDSTILDRADGQTESLKNAVDALRARFTEPGTLPRDIQRLAENVLRLTWCLDLKPSELWADLDRATAAGRGAKMLNLSPYGAILDALISIHGAPLFYSLVKNRSKPQFLFVPTEIELPPLAADVQARLVRPST